MVYWFTDEDAEDEDDKKKPKGKTVDEFFEKQQ